jgi:hypothetical protein
MKKGIFFACCGLFLFFFMPAIHANTNKGNRAMDKISSNSDSLYIQFVLYRLRTVPDITTLVSFKAPGGPTELEEKLSAQLISQMKKEKRPYMTSIAMNTVRPCITGEHAEGLVIYNYRLPSGETLRIESVDLHNMEKHQTDPGKNIRTFLGKLGMPESKKADNEQNAYYRLLNSKDKLAALLGVWEAWGRRQHVNPVLNGNSFFKMTAPSISGYGSLEIDDSPAGKKAGIELLKGLQSKLYLDSNNAYLIALPLFQFEKGFTTATKEEFAELYGFLGRWEFQELSFSPD